MNDDIERRLAMLDADPAPAAERFDAGTAFHGALAVLPSAFNPPTLAHQHLLESAMTASRASNAVALLTTRNVDKGVHGASLEHRIGMLLALRSEMRDLTVVASNQARIIDQADSLTGSFPLEALTFVMGFDTLERLFAPRYYTDMERELAPFFERHRVLAANRGEVSAGDVAGWISENAGSFTDRISVLEIEKFPASLSSSQVREALSSTEAHPALSLPVRRYILEHKLYRRGS